MVMSDGDDAGVVRESTMLRDAFGSASLVSGKRHKVQKIHATNATFSCLEKVEIYIYCNL